MSTSAVTASRSQLRWKARRLAPSRPSLSGLGAGSGALASAARRWKQRLQPTANAQVRSGRERPGEAGAGGQGAPGTTGPSPVFTALANPLVVRGSLIRLGFGLWFVVRLVDGLLPVHVLRIRPAHDPSCQQVLALVQVEDPHVFTGPEVVGLHRSGMDRRFAWLVCFGK